MHFTNTLAATPPGVNSPTGHGPPALLATCTLLGGYRQAPTEGPCSRYVIRRAMTLNKA